MEQKEHYINTWEDRFFTVQEIFEFISSHVRNFNKKSDMGTYGLPYIQHIYDNKRSIMYKNYDLRTKNEIESFIIHWYEDTNELYLIKHNQEKIKLVLSKEEIFKELNEIFINLIEKISL